MKGVREVLAKIEILTLLDPAILDQLALRFELESFRFGEAIFEEGDPGDKFYLVHSGRVRVVKRSDGQDVSVKTLGPGEHFGEVALLEDRPRSATIRSAADTTLLSLKKRDFDFVLRKAPRLREYFGRFVEDIAFRNFLRISTGFGRELSSKDVEELAGKLTTVSCAAGEPIDRASPALLVLQDGEVDVSHARGGIRQVLGRLLPGDTLGEDDLVGPRAELEFIARKACRFYRLEAEEARGLLDRFPGFQDYLVKRSKRWAILARDRRSTSSRILVRTTHRDGRTPKEMDPAEDSAVLCLEWVLGQEGKKVDRGRVRAVLAAGGGVVSPEGLAATADRLGLYARVLSMPLRELAECDHPLLVLLDGEPAVVRGRMGRHVLLWRPGTGLAKVPIRDLEGAWPDAAVLLEPAPSWDLADAPRGPWRHFLRYFARYRGLLGRLVVAALAYQVLGLASPRFTEAIVDKVAVHRDLGLLDVLFAGMVVVTTVRLALDALRSYVLAHVGKKVGFSLMRDFYDRLLSLPLAFFHEMTGGDLVRRFASHDRIQAIVMRQAAGGVLDLGLVAVCIAMMVAYSGTLTLWTLAFLLPLAAVAFAQAPLLRRYYRGLFDSAARYESMVVESIQAVETVKALSLEGFFFGRWREEYHRMSDLRYSLGLADLGFGVTTSFLRDACYVFLLWQGSRLVLEGGLSVGALMAYSVLASQVGGAIVNFAVLYAIVQDATVSLERLCEVIEREPEEPRHGEGRLNLESVEGSIEFRGVSFRYARDPKAPWILHDVSFDLPAGRRLAVVGRSGGGKTTLLRLLLGLCTPDEGRVRIDGVDVRHVALGTLRRWVALVPQDVFLVNGTIRENIAAGDLEADPARIEEAARLAALHDFVVRLPMGYDTVVGERGIALAGGQRQRIAVARAVYRNPRIVLLDEATAALDAATEAALQESLAVFLAGRTAVTVSHRLHTVREADLILVLDHGRVVERGTHESLLAENGLYYHLHSRLTGG
ncbi:MAG: peptidase domain-containing ABC transporter [Planctomycetes bacterium]|nr:peptidase domain-containing ABC transporter [Planctomycetota bacterium]